MTTGSSMLHLAKGRPTHSRFSEQTEKKQEKKKKVKELQQQARFAFDEMMKRMNTVRDE